MLEGDPFDDTWVEGEVWRPEPELEEDPIFLSDAQREVPVLSRGIRPSEFTSFAFRMPKHDGIGYENFSFEGRRHMKAIYDTPADRLLLFCARQVEKSTLLGNIALNYMCMVPAYRVLYVSPSATQTTTFSNDRIKEPIETSPVLRRFTTRMLSSNILEKQFTNHSKITLRYAFLNADRTRGIPAWLLEIDEFQDVLSDNIPVIEQCLAHAPERWKRFIYSGTPKTLDNTLEYYRSRLSTQGEWVVPCDAHGGDAGRYWNILGEKNIGKKGLVCEKCHALIDPMHSDAQWARMVEYDPIKAPFESFRIPQLMVPWKPWKEILLDYERYPRDKFYNEVLGISFDSGMRPLTTHQIRAVCREDIHISEVEKYRSLSFNQPVFAGIDWGTGENSYTVVVLATYVDMKFRVFFVHRFVGEEVDPPIQLERLDELLAYYNVRLIGSDYGGGFDRNDHLVRKFGPNRLAKYQYMARNKKKVEWDGKLGRWKVHRTEAMSDIFNAIKRKQCEFPAWKEFQDPYAQDMLNIFSEYNNQLRMIQYKHSQDKPDDTFHALLYAWLVSMLIYPRPDIITPTREVDGQQQSEYTGPTDQGMPLIIPPPRRRIIVPHRPSVVLGPRGRLQSRGRGYSLRAARGGYAHKSMRLGA